jgi:hypothetical protein
MKFLFLRGENIGCIDNAAVQMDCSALPANVGKVIWDSANGWLEYSDRPKLREPFTDPSVYQPLLNTAMTALETAAPPLTLAQAQAVKQTLIDALYAVKRTAPITVAVSVGSKTWDGSDEAIATMNQQVASATAGFSTSSLVTQINAMIAALNNDMTIIAGDFTPLVLSPPNGVFPGAWIWTYGSTKPAPPAGHYATVTGGGGVTGGPFPWLPLGATATVNLTLADLTTIVNAVVTRRQSVAGTRASKKAAVAALATIPAVIAYDVTTGWAY